MKILVIKNFRLLKKKNQAVLVVKGQELDLEKERANFIIQKGWGEEVKSGESPEVKTEIKPEEKPEVKDDVKVQKSETMFTGLKNLLGTKTIKNENSKGSKTVHRGKR